ncbi:hypothetical protein PSI23_07145 [Xenorhabdus sp. XENO-10]|uniref:IrrE N-terminal-like domain-containing protein n=1 Tax=Xenorhabdus yunnanensis TaxID=3025878 RepID=A0ABT5LDP5_9GAMM|nr:hypothetical protein [Xenorhabdus yunnanensis]MDC9589100.1 hypothetical protein [Xenorhabdus yunnanensis]
MLRWKKEPKRREISTSDLRSKGIEIIKHQEMNFLDYYHDNSFVLSNCYILGIHIKLLGKQGDIHNETKMKYINSISYALNKINKKVRNLSGVVKNINVYVAEGTGRTEVRWPKIEDENTYNKLISKGVWVESPCLHINDKQITQVNKIKSLPSSSWGNRWLRNKNHSGQVGLNVSGVSDQLHQESISGKRKLLESNPECSARVIASIVHEIGHILHAQRIESERKFWCARRTNEQGEYTIPAKIVEQVSDYAIQKNNSNEFVAEVFTGLVYGKKYSKKVLEYYQYYLGPELIGVELPKLPNNWSP